MKTETKEEMWNLNFPKETALPEKPFWKEKAPEERGSGLSVQDLLDPSYPDPIRQLLDRLEKTGYDVQGSMDPGPGHEGASRVRRGGIRRALPTRSGKEEAMSLEAILWAHSESRIKERTRR